MPPRKRADRLVAIVDAATELFAQQGFDRTQVVDIAARAGVSVGTVYGYVQDKEVLLVLCAERPFLDIAADRDLPVVIADRAEVIRRLDDVLDRHVRLPTLEASLATRALPKDEGALVDEVAAELYDLLARTRTAADAVERSARESPDLGDLFYRHGRARLLDQLASLCTRLARRHPLPPPLTPDLAARAVLETTTWWARHRHRDPDPPIVSEDDARAIAVGAARRIVLP